MFMRSLLIRPPNNKAQRKTSSTVQIAAFLLVFCDMAEEEGLYPMLVRLR